MITQQINKYAVGLDLVLNELSASLKSKLKWLDSAFTLSKTLELEKSGRKYKYPAAYIGNGEFVSLLPDSSLGNYLFIEKIDPETVVEKGLHKSITTNIQLIFWFNLSTIFVETEYNLLENVKHEIYKHLSSPWILSSSILKTLKIYTENENIFEKYSLQQVDNQFLMWPYAGIKFECSIKYSVIC